MLKKILSTFVSFLTLSTYSVAQHPETITPALLPPASPPKDTDLRSSTDALWGEVNYNREGINENREHINMHQTQINSKYPDLGKISYADGVLSLKPSWPEGTYEYTRDGETYETTARDVSIKLVDTAAISQNTANIKGNTSDIADNQNTIANNKATIRQNTTSIATNETAISQNTANIKGNTSNIADNKMAINNNTTNMNSNFAALDKISYDNNGILSFGSADPAARVAEKKIQLFDPDSASQSAGALNQEILRDRSMLTNLDQRTAATNQQIQNLQWQFNDLSGMVDKQGKAISVNAAFAALPSGYMPDKNFIGIGVGHFYKHTGIAVGLTRSFDNGVIIQGRYGASGGTSVASAAAGISF